MNLDLQKTCQACSQPFSLQASPKSRTPLLMTCGHSICEMCVKNMLKFSEPIDCKICQKTMNIGPGDMMLLKNNLYSVFPINIYVLGELTLQMKMNDGAKMHSETEYFIDLKKLLAELEIKTGKCVGCQRNTEKMCKQCDTILCEPCFHKGHSFHIFKSHILKNIESNVKKNFCKIHKEKQIDYFCKDCSKLVCIDCMIVGGEKSCKNHNVTSAMEMNESLYEQLATVAPKVDETFRRLTKTAVDIGHLLQNADQASGYTKIHKVAIGIQHHFNKLHAALQKHEQDLMLDIEKFKMLEKKSLEQSKKTIQDSIINSQRVINKINTALIPDNLNKVNFKAILDEANAVIDTPWHLKKEESSDETIELIIDEEIYNVISNTIKVPDQVNTEFKLLKTSEIPEEELPPLPPSIVYPPELTKDVRETSKPKSQPVKSEPQRERDIQKPKENFMYNAPKYRSKSGSNSSINSIGSEIARSTPNPRIFNNPVVHPVMPFAETNHPKALFEGAQEVIYISHINSPDNFFVQRSCHQNLVKELLREFRKAASFPKISAGNIVEGKMYLAYNKADKEWQRARIISIDRGNVDKTLYHVSCVDFGSVEIVDIDGLRLVPATRLHSPEPLAIHCSLANCEPRAGAWTAEDSLLIQKIIDNKQAVMHVRRIQSNLLHNMSVLCDITSLDDGVSLAHALVFHERARFRDPNLPYPLIHCLVEKPKLFLNNNDYKVKAVEEVIITHVVSPDSFFVRKAHLQNIYDKMREEMDEKYSLSVPTGTIYYPEIGMACAVCLERYTEQIPDGGWARAVVVDTPGRARVAVSLPDCGRSLLVHYAALRRLLPEFMRAKVLATECHLSGITPLGRKWNIGSVALLENYIYTNLEMCVEEKRKGSISLGVSLYDKSDSDNTICLNTEMIRLKFAISTGIYSFSKIIPTKENLIRKPEVANVPETKRQVQKEPITILTKKPKSAKKPIKDEDLVAKDKGPIKLEVKVLSCESPSLVYVALTYREKELNEMYEKLAEYYAKNKIAHKQDWKVGDRCCTICKETKTWRRAVITELCGDNAKVFYSDFASVETVPQKNLQVLAPEFTSCGDAAIKCHLSGILPGSGTEWPSLTKEYLSNSIETYPRIFITKNGAIKNDSLPVELWVYHITPGGALEPNSATWLCLNEDIIKAGLGIRDRTLTTTARDEKSAEAGNEDMISFLNLTGPIQDWLQLDLPSESQETLIPEDNRESTSSPCSEMSEAGMNDELKTTFVSEWLPPEPITSREFKGVPTYVDNDGVIYLHDIAQQSTLDLITKSLHAHFISVKKKSKYSKWTVGQPCIARYAPNNRYYRAKVREVNPDNSTCVVTYVDYGNEEICSFSDMRNSIVLHQIPIQAKQCVLGRIKPVKGAWDTTSLDFIHGTVVEKNCLIKVLGNMDKDILPVDIKIDKIIINDLLVDLQIATYSDGSKFVQKFAPIQFNKTASSSDANDSDSGPDYIPANDDSSCDAINESTDFSEDKSIKLSDWNKIVEEEEAKCNIITFASNELNDDFQCNVPFVNGNTFELNVIHDEEKNLLYDEMFAKLDDAAEQSKPLDVVSEDQACLALYSADNKWYRAKILGYCSETALAKVKYVDFGNIDVVPLANVKEINNELVLLPPASVSAKLHGISFNPNIDLITFKEKCEEVFFNSGPFQAKIKERKDAILFVELYDDKGSLIYLNLIEDNIFIKTES